MSPQEPDGNEALQLSWSRCRSEAICKGAQKRVRQALSWAQESGLDAGRVLVIGPQHGFELEQLRESGVKEILAIDIVEDFVQDCAAVGFTCLKCAVECMGEIIKDKWNVYVSHTLEHCYDIEAAVEQIKMVVDKWCCIVVPIEEKSSKDKAHLSRIQGPDVVPDLFKPMQITQQRIAPSQGQWLFTWPDKKTS